MAGNLTTEKKLELIRQITALADGVTLEYVKSLSEVINDPQAEASEKRKAFSEMDKVLRVAKQYSDRVLLAEGKTTANIGVGGSGSMPFEVIVTKTYETKPEVEKDKSADFVDKTD